MQFYPNFALFSTLGGMNLDQDFFQMSKLSEDQKRRFSPEMEYFFCPNLGEDQKKKIFLRNGTLFLSTDLRSDAHQSQSIGGDADEDHTQIVGGIYPPIPPCFSTTASKTFLEGLLVISATRFVSILVTIIGLLN